MDGFVRQRLVTRMATYGDLLATLPERALAESLPVPSDRIGTQLWCVVGARESYARAIEAGGWQDFACSLTYETTARADSVRAALDSSSEAVGTALDAVEDWTSAREELVLDLLEHEAQHQGQLIRYVYGLGYSFPDSWKQRWNLG